MINHSKKVYLPILTNLGTDYRCYKIAQTLQKKGWTPIILCDKPKTSLGKKWDGFSIVELTQTSHLDNFFRSFFVFNFKVFLFLLRNKADLIISEDCAPLLSAALAGKIKNTPVVYDSHELFLETEHVNGSLLKKTFWRFWHHVGFVLCKKNICVSPHFITEFKKAYPQKEYFLLPNYPLKSPLAPRIFDKQEPRLLFQGYLRNDTNLEGLIKILPSLPGFHLTVVGEGEARNQLIEMVSQLDLKNRVDFKDAVDFETLTKETYGAHIGINLVSPATKSMDLTWGNKIFEYCQKGLPVISSFTKGLDTLYQKYPLGIQVNPLNPESVRKGLEDMVENHEIYKKSVADLSHELIWEKSEDQLIEFLKK